jgi:hypothetical protein
MKPGQILVLLAVGALLTAAMCTPGVRPISAALMQRLPASQQAELTRCSAATECSSQPPACAEENSARCEHNICRYRRASGCACYDGEIQMCELPGGNGQGCDTSTLVGCGYQICNASGAAWEACQPLLPEPAPSPGPPCGKLGATCCGTTCEAGAACNSQGVCERCGGDGEPCCSGGCNPPLACGAALRCERAPPPPPCGHEGQACCGNGCFSPALCSSDLNRCVPPPPVARKTIEVEVEDIDDEAFLWADRGNDTSKSFARWKIGQGAHRVNLDLDPSRDSRMFVLRFTNSGCMGSKGTRRIFVNGELRDERKITGGAGCDWFYRYIFRADFLTGGIEVLKEQTCGGLPTDSCGWDL